tara:strand:- start:95 stop:373 length:279 start_codon:yes stop_codon:yes gene_type:complete
MEKINNIKNIIEGKIKKKFPDAKFKINDTSYKHKKHIQNKFQKESHFEIYILSKEFYNLSKLERQKKFFNFLGKDIIKRIHSISMILKSPKD